MLLTDRHKKLEYSPEKPSDAVRLEGRLSSSAKQLFNILLRNGFPESEPLLSLSRNTAEQEYQVLVSHIQEKAPNLGTLKRLRDTLASLALKIRYNIVDVGGIRRRGFVVLLPWSEIDEKEGICRYAFNCRLPELMSNSVFKAQMSLLLRQRYKGGKYGMRIYELCRKYTEDGETPFFSIEDLKQYLGVHKSSYQEFKIFNRDLLKPVVMEINSQTNLKLELSARKTGRKTTHLSFVVKSKPNDRSVSVVASASSIATSEKHDKEAIVRKLLSLGVSESLANRLRQIYSFQSLSLAVSVLEKYRDKRGRKGQESSADEVLLKIINLRRKRLTAKQTPVGKNIGKGTLRVEIESRYRKMSKKIVSLSERNREELRKFLGKSGLGK